VTDTLLDSNIILDVVTNDPVWADWSIEQIVAARLTGQVIIDAIVYAEICCGVGTIDAADEIVRSVGGIVVATPRGALFLAAQASLDYRRRGGRRSSILPDFFVGAHAFVLSARLVTRDPKRFRQSFPDLEIIAP
jgi:predicted nucleic acid-binding protein